MGRSRRGILRADVGREKFWKSIGFASFESEEDTLGEEQYRRDNRNWDQREFRTVATRAG